MRTADVVIVGGGPAGSSCAGELIKAGFTTIILDQYAFPREKPCAGWITPRVFSLLGADPGEYPCGLSKYGSLHMRIKKIPLTIPTRQYAVRRIEFDDWMVRRSKAELHRHRVMKIEQTGEGFIIDGLFQAEFLVGAGGTRCPVAEYFFKDRTHENGRSNIKDRKIAALEEEVEADGQNKSCRLWFFEEGLAGYSWLVPKEGGFAAIGVGGLLDRINQTGNRIWDFWEHHIKRLEAAGLIREQKHVPRGHVYLRRWKNGQTQPVQKGRVLITGDAAGLATRDMGEGIEPAVESGIRAARSIITGAGYSVSGIKKYSLPAIVFPPKLP